MSINIRCSIETFFVWGVVGGVIFSLSGALAAVQEGPLPESSTELDSSFNVIQNNSVFSNSEHYLLEHKLIHDSNDSKTMRVAVTAYSSCPSETDGDPYITASGNWVQDGIVAANFLPFGTELKIPELYGNKIFVVQDRMHPRKKYQIDIWFPSKAGAIEFGAHYTYIELIEEF